MTVQAAEAALAVKQGMDEKKARKKEQVDKERARDYGAGPEPKQKTDDQGNARFRTPKSSGGSGPKARGGGAPSGSRGARAVNWAWSGNRKVLTAQFVLCAFILILGTLTSDDKAKLSGARALVKGSALALLFFLLALLSSAGGSSAKAATAMGTLVTAAYALTSSDVHAVVKWVGSFFGSKAKTVGKSADSADTTGANTAGALDDSGVGTTPGSTGPGSAQTEPGHTVTEPGGSEVVTGTVR